MEADDVPTHHKTVGDFVDLARRVAEESTDLAAFGHDMLNAYRQWLVQESAGVRLWMHVAMCFGVLLLNALDFTDLADSAHHTFSGIFGDRLTDKAKQGPAAGERTGDPAGQRRQPTERRIAKLQAIVRRTLDTGALDEAGPDMVQRRR